MSKYKRIRVIAILIAMMMWCTSLIWARGVLSGNNPAATAEPDWGNTVRNNLSQILTALLTYSNEWGKYPTQLSMLYPNYISDPAVFWNPGDDNPCPTTIDNDMLNASNSAQISFLYFGANLDSSEHLIVAQDNSLANNGGNGVYALVPYQVEFYTPTGRSLPSVEIARTNLAQIGTAMQSYAANHEGHYPEALSMLYSNYIADPTVFWNPGDDLINDPPAPTTINNDIPDKANSAQISYAYLGASYTLGSDPGSILVQDRSPSNNGGVLVNILTADGHVETFAPTPISCNFPSACSARARANLNKISRALYTYGADNYSDFPPNLSFLYRHLIFDPRVYWNPNDIDEWPLTIDNDIPDQPNSAQISYAYISGASSDDDAGDVIAQDNTLDNNSGLGVNIMTADGAVEYFERCDRWLPSSEIARTNLGQIGVALHQYAANHGGQFPDSLSMLYPSYIADPAVFWNPGDKNPCPTTINNDTRNQNNSAAISYAYFGAGHTSDCSDGLILVVDNSMSNNGGSSVNILTANGSVACYAPTPPSCTNYAYCRTWANANLRGIGSALYSYAAENNSMLPSQLSQLYPDYIDRPTTFWNPGDTDSWPLIIDNDLPDQLNSAQISYDFVAAGQNLDHLWRDDILLQDNTPANNGGYSINVLYGDGHVATVLMCNDPFADIDGDGDVDQSDFGVLQRCLNQETALTPPECECFDRPVYSKGDGDIDQDDLEAFMNCRSGPGVPADPACDD